LVVGRFLVPPPTPPSPNCALGERLFAPMPDDGRGPSGVIASCGSTGNASIASPISAPVPSHRLVEERKKERKFDATKGVVDACFKSLPRKDEPRFPKEVLAVRRASLVPTIGACCSDYSDQIASFQLSAAAF
jgi:hypothetical protein